MNNPPHFTQKTYDRLPSMNKEERTELCHSSLVTSSSITKDEDKSKTVSQ